MNPAATKLRAAVQALVPALLAACSSLPPDAVGLAKIEHIVVIYPENRSFDHLYGLFPGANGIADATPQAKTQLDHDGRPLPHLPPVYTNEGKADARFPQRLPNGPFRIDAPPVNARFDQVLPSPIHNYWQNREQINGGANNLFVAMTTVGAWTMGYYDGSAMKMWQWARDYTLADNFFMAAYGGSFLNHQWLVCACTPRHADAPASVRAQLDANGNLKRKPGSPASVMDGPVELMDGRVTPDGWVVNTSQPPFQPSGIPPAADGPRELADAAKLPVPPQTAKTIGDTLSAKGVSWAWYSGGWNAAVADGTQESKAKRNVIYNREAGSPIFQPHHQPFNYFARFAPGSPDRARHLKDGADFVAAIETGTLPQVSFYKPSGRDSQHPSYTDLLTGDRHIDELLQKLRKSPQWPRMAVIVTYDENGGFWDHAPPPTGSGYADRWGPGTRIPAVVISPFARRGYVDSTPYDTTSILKLITRRFGLEALPGVREKTGDLTGAFTF
jgi:acid phosphatase